MSGVINKIKEAKLWERERISGLQRDLLYQYLKKEAR